MKHLSNILAGLLGLAFVAFGLMFLFGMAPKQPDPPEGCPSRFSWEPSRLRATCIS